MQGGGSPACIAFFSTAECTLWYDRAPMTEPQVSPADVRRHFAGYPFGEPCTEDQLARAESLLRQPIPPVLRRLYLDFNGFLGPTNASFFWPLCDPKPGDIALVEMNRFFRDETVFPQELTSKCLFYGDAGIGGQWGLKNDLPGKIILWNAEWGEDYEVVGTDLLQVWVAQKQEYDVLASQQRSGQA